MSLLLPLQTGEPSYVTALFLDGKNYQIRFDWNDRSARWYFTLNDSDGNAVAAGLALVIGAPLLQGVTTDPRQTPGDFMAEDTSGKDLEAGLNDLGTRVLVHYISATGLPTP